MKAIEMKRVFKYPLLINDEQTINMPRGAVIRAVMLQRGQLCLWAEVEPDALVEARVIWIVGTGHLIPDLPLVYITSVIDGQFVWHVYEKP